MRIEERVWQQIINELGNAPIESGGILGKRNKTVCAFFLDPRGGKEQYKPNTRYLNRVLKRWAKEGIVFAGLAHSHPNGVTFLSREDMSYAQKIALAACAADTLYFPVLARLNGQINIAVHALSGGAWTQVQAEFI